MRSFPPVPTFLATSLLGLGLCRIFAPRAAYSLFGLPLSPNSPPSPFLYASAGRELALGLTYVLLGLQSNREGLKALMVGTVIERLLHRLTLLQFGIMEAQSLMGGVGSGLAIFLVVLFWG